MGENLMAPGPVHKDRAAEESEKPGPTVENEEPEGHAPTPAESIPAKGDSTPPEPAEQPEAELPAGREAEPPSTSAATFDDDTVAGFRDRWRELQADFVDDPARAVRNADGLVDEIMRELAKRKDGLEERWRDGPGDTEELRVAMTEYRSFFNQLLNA